MHRQMKLISLWLFLALVTGITINANAALCATTKINASKISIGPSMDFSCKKNETIYKNRCTDGQSYVCSDKPLPFIRIMKTVPFNQALKMKDKKNLELVIDDK